jgi:hypothetical protein
MRASVLLAPRSGRRAPWSRSIWERRPSFVTARGLAFWERDL